MNEPLKLQYYRADQSGHWWCAYQGDLHIACIQGKDKARGIIDAFNSHARLKEQVERLTKALERFYIDHGHTMSEPRETCIYCQARAAIKEAEASHE